MCMKRENEKGERVERVVRTGGSGSGYVMLIIINS